MNNTSVEDLLARLSPNERAQLIARLRGTGDRDPRAGPVIRQQLRRTDVSGTVQFPLSFAQRRFWFFEQLAPGSGYMPPTAMRLSGALDLAALERALNALVDRHEILRTTFIAIDGEPRQVVAPSIEINVPIIDLRHLDGQPRSAETQRIISDEARRPFDLTSGPLLRTKLLHLAADDWVLLLTMHHIISDGWSMRVLTRELSVLYEAFQRGARSPLSPLPIQYADFAVWQRQRLEESKLEEQIAYWRERLSGASGVLELPTDHPRPRVRRHYGALQRFVIPAALARALRTLSQREGVTLFMTLFAGFAALLSHYSGQRDVLMGTLIANRTSPDLERLIGFFVNVLVLRTDLSGDPSVRELLRQVRETTLDAYDHQDVPFDVLVEALRPARDPSRSPIIQAIFQLQNTPPEVNLPKMARAQLPAYGARADAHLRPGRAKPLSIPLNAFDLTVNVSETPHELDVRLEYSTDLFETETIRRLSRHYRRLLKAFVSNPDQNISAITLLTPRERLAILDIGNSSTTKYPRDCCVQELFEQQVRRTPDAIAVEHCGRYLTYDALDRRATHLAGYLRAVGVGAEVVVGLCLPRSLELIVASLATLKAGGACLPLDPATAAESLDCIIRDAGAAVLIASNGPELKHSNGVRIIDPTDETLFIARDRDQPPVGARPTPDSLAYVVRNSVSTSTPRVIGIPHRALVNYLRWATRRYSEADGHDMAVERSIAVDSSITTLLAPLLLGLRVVLVSENGTFDALEQTASGASRVGLARLTPAYLERLRQRLARNQVASWAGTVIVAGDALPGPIVKRWLMQAPRASIVYEYGRPEPAVGCCFHEVTREDVDLETVTIGRPISNTELYVLDEGFDPVAIGVVGQLYVGGDGLARGYLGQPALTADRFIPNPYGHTRGGRLFRTGDSVRCRADGRLELVTQCPARSAYGVQLQEMEVLLRSQPGVQDAAVLDIEDEVEGGRLVAFVVPTSGPEAESERLAALENAVRLEHTSYMVPSELIALEALPLASSGKVDRSALLAQQPRLAR